MYNHETNRQTHGESRNRQKHVESRNRQANTCRIAKRPNMGQQSKIVLSILNSNTSTNDAKIWGLEIISTTKNARLVICPCGKKRGRLVN